ncbi:torsin-1A-like [Stylophora pistillata]|nr:torsin-1A-like [Stylophora pistillata]
MERKERLVLLVIILCAPQIHAPPIEDIAVVASVGVAIIAGIVSLPNLYCHFTECCEDKNSADIAGLQTALRWRVFGQHLVSETVLKALVGHLNDEAPNKALAISFNGWTGSGKNFVSKIIAEHIFKKGMKSNYVHLIIATHHYPHQSDVEIYKRQLRDLVERSVSKCPRSMFIFDEMDKMPLGLVDVLKPYLDYHPPGAGKIDFRQSIFIFLSNTGGDLINAAVIKHWKDGKKREDIKIKEMDEVIKQGEFDDKGGFWHSSLIEKHLIDYFIPFLPLERSHIKLCAEAELRRKGHPVSELIFNKVADELSYFPKDLEVFSQSGCKKISSKVDYVMG